MFIWYLNDSLVAKTFYKSSVDGVQADSMTKLRKQNHLWSVKPIYCRKKKINMHDIFAGLGSVHEKLWPRAWKCCSRSQFFTIRTSQPQITYACVYFKIVFPVWNFERSVKFFYKKQFLLVLLFKLLEIRPRPADFIYFYCSWRASISFC